VAASRLDHSFFNRPTLTVARQLLGAFIVTKRGGSVRTGMIIEIEAYKGPEDRASHAFGGRRTPRVEPLYGDGGTAYVYICYGIHWMLNFATCGEGRPEGVLVRGIAVGHGGRSYPILGPGLVTRYLRVDGSMSGADGTRSAEIRVEDRGVRFEPRSVLAGPRIGVEPAGEPWASRPWRYRVAPDVIKGGKDE
jgi:DNA-3-methyladenine glycosylase